MTTAVHDEAIRMTRRNLSRSAVHEQVLHKSKPVLKYAIHATYSIWMNLM